jgi:hypothetical protein
MAENNAMNNTAGLGSGVVAASAAEPALAALDAEAHNRIIQALRSLSGRKPWEWSGVHAVSLAGAKPDYYMLSVAPDWRVIIRQTESGQIEIFDVFRAERLQLFRELGNSVGAPS